MALAYRSEALDVLPEVQSLAEEVLAPEKLEEINLVAHRLLGKRDERRWAIAKATLEVGLHPSRPLLYWLTEMEALPRNTRNCIRYLGDYIDLLVKEMAHELVGSNARRNSLGRNAKLLIDKAPSIKDLAWKLKKYSNFLYTPGKHDFNLPLGRRHRFTAKEVVVTCYITAALAKQILTLSKLARVAVEKDNLYEIGGRWGSPYRVKYDGDPLERRSTSPSD